METEAELVQPPKAKAMGKGKPHVREAPTDTVSPADSGEEFEEVPKENTDSS